MFLLLLQISAVLLHLACLQGFPTKESNLDLVWTGLHPREECLPRMSNGDSRSDALSFTFCELCLAFQKLTIQHLFFFTTVIWLGKGGTFRTRVLWVVPKVFKV